MKSRKTKWFLLGFLLCVSMILGSTQVTYAANAKKGRILFISSYTYGWNTVQIQIEGIKDGVGQNVDVDYEFMDTKRVNDETSMKMFYEGLKYRLSKVEPYDAVILGDDAALLFALEHQKELFEDIPLIFEGVNDVDLAKKAAENPMITGVVEQLSVEKNIAFGLELNPKAQKVIAILDDTITGKVERKNFYSYAEKFPDLNFSEINASALTTAELKRQLSRTGEDSILIYVVMTEDASGKKYSDNEAIKLLTRCAGVPVMRMVEAGIGQGLLGGNVVSMHRSGEIAAEMAMKIINGTPCSKIEVVLDSPNVYCLDEQVMLKYGMDTALIPADAVVVNHETTFGEKYQELLLPLGMLFLTLILIIMVVCVDNYKRRRLMIELEEARGIMEAASQHDFLTGLPNRSKFMEDLDAAITLRAPFTIMMLDIDNFKTINDTFGHTAGDDALKQLAARLKEINSQIFTSYRFAGDEFIVILKSKSDKIVDKAAHQCRQVFDKPFILDGEKRKVGGSIGIASYPKDAVTIEQLIVCADAAMYEVKNSGKNNFAYYHKDV